MNRTGADSSVATHARPLSFRIVHRLRWLFSFVTPQRVVRRSSPHHARLEVTLVRGRAVLDGATVNYSYGGLHQVFEQAFTRLEIEKRNLHSVLVLGLGAGSVVHLLRRDFSVRAPITAVEIDPVIVELGRDYFGLSRWPNLEVVTGDAVQWAAHSSRRFDLVVVDLFDEAEVPSACRTTEFLETLRERLTPGGLLTFNVVASKPAARVEAHRFAAQFEQTLGGTRALEVRGNLMLVFERPRAESLVVDDPERRYSPRGS